MPPSDEEMIRHFTTHEVAFRKVYEIMAESSEGSFHYPPLSPEEVIILDSMEQSDTSHETNDEQDIPVYGLLKPERILLDSLLSEIGCGFILVDRREWGTADSVYVSLVMPYYSHGIVDAGTSKSFVYDPGLRSRRNIRITEHGDLKRQENKQRFYLWDYLWCCLLYTSQDVSHTRPPFLFSNRRRDLRLSR